jgi:hypothetical protein
MRPRPDRVDLFAIAVIALIVVAGVAMSQGTPPDPMVAQCMTELTKTSRERDAGSDYVAAVLTQLADAKAQAAAANQQIAGDQARIGNLIDENKALTKERDELKAKAKDGVVDTAPPPHVGPQGVKPQIDSAP